MSFKDEIYPNRNNRMKFVSGLIQGVDTKWKKVTTVGQSYILPGFIHRKNIVPVYFDRQRIKALLNAWLRRISDRYLDLSAVEKFAFRRFTDQNTLFNTMKRNATQGGAVKFIRDEIELSGKGQRGSIVFFGPDLFENWSYDSYYSYLLDWGDKHCFGLIRKLQMQTFKEVAGGGSSTQDVWRAARNWVIANKNNGVYKLYNIKLD